MTRLLALSLMIFIGNTNPGFADAKCPPQQQALCAKLQGYLASPEGQKIIGYYAKTRGAGIDGEHLYVPSRSVGNDIINALQFTTAGGTVQSLAAITRGYYSKPQAYQNMKQGYGISAGDIIPYLVQQISSYNPQSQNAQFLHFGRSEWTAVEPAQAPVQTDSFSITVPALANTSNQPSTTSSTPHAPKMISLQAPPRSPTGSAIDKFTVNKSFITAKAGNHLDQNERAYLFDSNNNIWSCKVSEMGARSMHDQSELTEQQGHVEALHFQSRSTSHIPGNHAIGNGCLISVQK